MFVFESTLFYLSSCTYFVCLTFLSKQHIIYSKGQNFLSLIILNFLYYLLSSLLCKTTEMSGGRLEGVEINSSLTPNKTQGERSSNLTFLKLISSGCLFPFSL